jgi:hypothetical protein
MKHNYISLAHKEPSQLKQLVETLSTSCHLFIFIDTALQTSFTAAVINK